MKKSLFPAVVAVLAFLCLAASTAHAIGPARKLFGRGNAFQVEELPDGKLKTKLRSLRPQIREKAIKRLHDLQFDKADAASHLRVDEEGGVFIICPDNHGNCDGIVHAHAAEDPSGASPGTSDAPVAATGITETLVPPIAMNAALPVSSPPAYNSRPGATRHIYLDFNGALVSGKDWSATDGVTTWTSWDCAAWSEDGDATTFSDSEQQGIRRIWERIKEDYAPFDINVTTDVAYDSVNYTGDKNQVGWLLFTRTTDKNGARCPHFGSGGVAYLNVFGQLSYFSKRQPAWVAIGSTANMAEAGSHEMGHNLGLSHDGRTLPEEYYDGHAATASAPAWGPIMGSAYGKNVSQWSKGEYYNANLFEDDLALITSKVPYRDDDHGDTGAASSVWLNPSVNQSGVIERTNNADCFSFTTGAGTISFNAAAFKGDTAPWGSNLDIKLELYNSSLTYITGSNPAADVDASISRSVAAGEYYLFVKPSSAGTPASSTPSGYTSYASLGQYTVTGSFIPANTIALTSPNGGQNWLIGSNQNITWESNIAGNVKIELLKGGVLDSTIVSNTPNDGSFSWTVPSTPTPGATYRVRITSVESPAILDQSVSNFTLVRAPLYAASMDSNPGWTLDTGWAYGQPTGADQDTKGLPDPTSGYNGTNVIGYRLNGDYDANIGSTRWAKTPAINCSGGENVTLNFWRWLGVEGLYDNAFIEVSNNGTTWTKIWENSNVRNVNDDDGTWVNVEYDISAVADGQPTVYIRFGLNSDTIEHFCGWNIDEVVVDGDPIGDALVVTPSTGFSPSGNFGGPFSPATKQYTLQNTGVNPIVWTATKDASWVNLSATGGTLAAGASTTVTVSLTAAANSLEIGNFTDTVAFNNSTNGIGNTTREVALAVNPINATVTLGNLLQTYDGSPKPITVTTTPSGLTYSLTYAGSTNAPSNGGNYAVVATITDPNYTGTASGTLTISKASQTISFAALATVLDITEPFALTASASSGLTVSYGSSNAAVATVSDDIVTIMGVGSTTITASQAGNANYLAASAVPQTLNVVRANPLAVAGGPYTVIVGAALPLDGSASQPSNGEIVTNYSWDLNNDSTFGDATGANPTITYAALTGTWGRTLGANTIQLKVTDSSGKTATGSTILTLTDALAWDANGTGSGQTDGAGVWLASNQWWNGAANQTWVAGSEATFGGPNNAGGAVTLASPTSVLFFNFNPFTGTYTLGTAGQALTINGGISKNAGSGTVSFASPLILGAAQAWTNNSTSSTTSLNLLSTLNNQGHLLTIGGSARTHIGAAGSVISGSGGITKTGTGQLILGSAANPVHTYTGPTTITGGAVMISTAGLGSGNLTLNGGVLEQFSANTFSRSLGVGAGQIQIPGGNSGFSGAGISNSSFFISGLANDELIWGSSFFAPTVLTLQSSNVNASGKGSLANNIDLAGSDRLIAVVSGESTGGFTLSGVIRNSTGTAGFTKSGIGHLILSGNNTYNGVTAISGGVIAISHANALGSSAGNTTIAPTGSIYGAQLKLSNDINSAENIIVTGTTEALSFVPAISNTSGTNTLSGDITLNNTTGDVRFGTNAGQLSFSGNISQTTSANSLIFITADNSSIIVSKAIANNGGVLNIFNTTQTTGTGTVTLGGVSGSGLGATSVSRNGILKLGVSDALNTSANLIIGEATDTTGHDIGTFDLAGFNQTVNALIGTKNNTGSVVAANSLRKVTNSAAGTGTNILTVGNGNSSGTFNGAIVDGATAKVALTKTGSGAETLAGSNSYTGATTIQGGRLILGASNVLPNTTAVSIGNAILSMFGGVTDTTGTLDVTGTAGINLGSSSSKLAFAGGSGAWAGTLQITGSFTPGLSIRFGTTNAGLTPAQLAKISMSGSGSFMLDSSGFLVFENVPPTLTSIVDNKSGGPVPPNMPVTYTVTFNEDMDASTVTATDFGNAGNANINIGAITETSPGVFTVLVTPTAVGTLRLQINPSAVLTDLAGNSLNTASALLDDTTLLVQTLYDGWAGTHGLTGGDALATANPDGDTLTNLQEFAFGTDPMAVTTGPITYVSGGSVTSPGQPAALNFAVGGGVDFRAVFGRRKDHLAAGLTYTVQFSADMTQWVNSSATPTLLTSEVGTGEIDATSVPYPLFVPVATGFKKPTFFRVGVSSD